MITSLQPEVGAMVGEGSIDQRKPLSTKSQLKLQREMQNYKMRDMGKDKAIKIFLI